MQIRDLFKCAENWVGVFKHQRNKRDLEVKTKPQAFFEALFYYR